MLVVKIEIHGAVSGRVSEIGRMLIGNVSSSYGKRGDYAVKVLRRRKQVLGPTDPKVMGQWKTAKVTRTGEVLNYPRLSYNVWRLVSRALLSAFPEEAPPGASEPEPGAPIAMCTCPSCGERISVEHGDEPGQVVTISGAA